MQQAAADAPGTTACEGTFARKEVVVAEVGAAPVEEVAVAHGKDDDSWDQQVM